MFPKFNVRIAIEKFFFSVEEIVSFSQYDLAPEMVGIVDAHDAVFVWLGQHCCPRAKDDPRSIALAYLAQGEYFTLLDDFTRGKGKIY